MKRFEDVLRIISGILLGALVRDFDDLRGNFTGLFATTAPHFADTFVAQLTTILLICVFLRNIHGSVRYDDAVEGSDFQTALEKNHFGRFVEFSFALAALFCGPSLVGHYIAHHAVVRDPTGKEALKVLLSGEQFAFLLFFPFAIYFVWDVLLWVGSDAKCDGSNEMERVAYNWILMDCLGLACVLAIGYVELYQRGRGGHFNFEVWALTFSLVASAIVFGDYFLNRSFYFPERSALADS